MQTPPKRASKGRKPKVDSTNDYFYRFCKCALKVKYGDFEKISYMSTENLFGHSKGFEGKPTLQELCGELGFLLEKNPNKSERACKSCAQKIRNAHELYIFNKNNLKRIKDRDSNSPATSRFKRQLPSSVCSPDRSPQVKKGLTDNEGKNKACSSRKSLVFGSEQSVQPVQASTAENIIRRYPLKNKRRRVSGK